jgi:hypothetical protein
MEESEINKNEEIQDGGQTVFLASGNIDGANTFIFRNATAAVAGRLSLANVQTAVNRFNNQFYNTISSTPNITIEGSSIPNRPLFLSDLLELSNPSSEISRIFNTLPIAQFKHLPDPSVLNRVSIGGGQYDLSDSSDSSDSSANPVDETAETAQPSSTEQTETVPETSEELPSLEVEEPVSGGASKSRKWSSHKKKRHTRIRTKKNKKL